MSRLYNIFISIIISLILFKFFDLKLDDFFTSIKTFHIVILFIFSFISFFLSSLRFKYILLSTNQNLKLLSSIKLTVYQNFFNAIALPGVGELVKYYKKKKIPNIIMGASIIMEKISGFISMAFIVFITLLYFLMNHENKKYILIFFGAIFLFLIVFRLFIKKRLFYAFPYLHFVLNTLLKVKTNNVKIYFYIFITSTLIQLVSIALYIILLHLNGTRDLNLFLLVMAIPTLNFVASLPISFGGIGTRDLLGLYLFSIMGISSIESLHTTYIIGISGILISIIYFLITLIVSFFYSRIESKRP